MYKHHLDKLPKASILKDSGDFLYYHDVKTKEELLALITFMIETIAINPSTFESKNAIFKVNGTLYRLIVAASRFYECERYFTTITLYKANEELIPHLVDWDVALDRSTGSNYSFTDIWLTVEEDVTGEYLDNPKYDAYTPKYLTDKQCYAWLNKESPAFGALFASLDKSNA